MTTGFTKKKIKGQHTVGEKLKLARSRMGYSLDLVENETKVNFKYLQLIEDDNYGNLPADVYVYGFLRRWAEFLHLNESELIKQYKNEKKLAVSISFFKKIAKPSNILKPETDTELLKASGFIITPKLILSSMVLIFVIGILSYIWYQVKGFAAAPPLELNSTQVEQVVKVESISITGQTDPGAALFINNQAVSVDNDGSFSQMVKLNSGVNNIEIMARNKANKETKKAIKLLAEY